MWEELLMHILLNFRFKVSMNCQKTTSRVLSWSHLSKLESTVDTKWSGWDRFHLLWKVWSCIDTHWGNECNNYCKLELAKENASSNGMVGFELAKEKASSNGMVGFCWLLMPLTIVIIHVSFAFALGVVVLKCSISH
jgi:hypothetical protein